MSIFNEPTLLHSGASEVPSTPVQVATPCADAFPRILGRYELMAVLGKGGVAQVFRAELHGPSGFRKPVALKIIRTQADDPLMDEKVLRLIREGCLAGRLKHPNIIDVYELGEANGQPFIVMELVEGLTLAKLIVTAGPLPGPVVLEIALAITAGLVKAHGLISEGRPAGLVHGDLKPTNILLSWDGDIKIADFGAATVERDRAEERTPRYNWGTPSYMSPEQLRMEELDGRSDLFTLALVICGMVLRANPLGNRRLLRLLQAGRPLQAPLLSNRLSDRINAVIPGLGRVLLLCLSPDRENRYANAAKLYADLQQLQSAAGHGPRLHDWLAGLEADVRDRVVSELPGAPGSDWSDVNTLATPSPCASGRRH